MSDIFGQVVEILSEALNVEASEIRRTSTLQGDLGVESIDVLDIIFRLERTFNIKITAHEMFPKGIETFTVQSIINYVERMKND